jgi:hypothetical protein
MLYQIIDPPLSINKYNEEKYLYELNNNLLNRTPEVNMKVYKIRRFKKDNNCDNFKSKINKKYKNKCN